MLTDDSFVSGLIEQLIEHYSQDVHVFVQDDTVGADGSHNSGLPVVLEHLLGKLLASETENVRLFPQLLEAYTSKIRNSVLQRKD